MDCGCVVRIQTLIPICRKTEQYARPLSWRGQGRGVDLGQNLTKDGVKVVEVINESGAVWGANWNPSPEELMERWQLVTVETLWKEREDERTDHEEGTE
jgi:hypothetical protein